MVAINKLLNKLVGLQKSINDLSTKQVAVGFFDTAHYPDGTPVAYVAAIQEFGSPQNNIPPRPFMRPTMEENRKEFSDMMARGCAKVLDGSLTSDQMLGQFGMVVAGAIKESIVAVNRPALSDSTMRSRRSRKADKNPSTKPLVDTGLMLASVDSKVINK